MQKKDACHGGTITTGTGTVNAVTVAILDPGFEGFYIHPTLLKGVEFQWTVTPNRCTCKNIFKCMQTEPVELHHENSVKEADIQEIIIITELNSMNQR